MIERPDPLPDPREPHWYWGTPEGSRMHGLLLGSRIPLREKILMIEGLRVFHEINLSKNPPTVAPSCDGQIGAEK